MANGITRRAFNFFTVIASILPWGRGRMNPAEIINGYISDVTSGKLSAAKWERGAVVRYCNDLRRAADSSSPVYFDTAKAERVIALIELLEHSTGKFAGTKFILEPWQKFIIWNLYGWYRRADRTRRFRKFYVEIGRKNGKTAIAAAIAIIEFVFNGEHRPEVYCVATKRAQSQLVWDEATRMVNRSPYLKGRINITPNMYLMKEIGGGLFKALGGDGGGDDGLNPSCVIFDEVHEWLTKGHMKLWDKMHTGSDNRQQPLFGVITTAGDKNSELWKQQRKYAESVALDEVFDDSLFAFICALEEDDDEFDPDNWRRANPGLDTIKNRSGLEELAEKARHDPTSHNQLLRYHCNRIVEPSNQFISLRIWDRNAGELGSLSGRLAFGGVDLGTRDDLSSFALVFPPLDEEGDWHVRAWSWSPKQNPHRTLTELPYSLWVENEYFETTSGNVTDFSAIYDRIDRCQQIYNIKSIGLDGNNATEFGTNLVSKGFQVDELNQQATGYNESMVKIKTLVTEGRFHHGGQPVLRWACGNMVARTSNGLTRPDKESSKDKIDPMVATLMAIRQQIANHNEGETGSRVRVIDVG